MSEPIGESNSVVGEGPFFQIIQSVFTNCNDPTENETLMESKSKEIAQSMSYVQCVMLMRFLFLDV